MNLVGNKASLFYYSKRKKLPELGPLFLYYDTEASKL